MLSSSAARPAVMPMATSTTTRYTTRIRHFDGAGESVADIEQNLRGRRKRRTVGSLQQRMADGTVTTHAAPRLRCVMHANRLRLRLVTADAVRLDDGEAARLDLDRLVKVLQREALRVP